jgi:hypothetical protein
MKLSITAALAVTTIAATPANAITPGMTLCEPALERTVKRDVRHAYAHTRLRPNRLARVELALPCLAPDAARRVRLLRRELRREWRQRTYWVRQFSRLSLYDRTWAIRIGECESGNAPTTDTGNGFLGSHQWVLSTWHMAGGSGSPVDASWHEQAVRAVRWRNRTSTTQWPACSVALGYA